MAHPIYDAAAAQIARSGRSWITATDTARLIRDRLKGAFPGVTFYVRTESYAGGASIDVYYDGLAGYAIMEACYCASGPTPDEAGNRCTVCNYLARREPVMKPGMPDAEAVKAVVEPYGGRGFDGMIDLAYSKDAWLSPDGSAAYGRSGGTENARGSDPGYEFPAPEAGAILVSFGANYVFVRDSLPFDIASKRAS